MRFANVQDDAPPEIRAANVDKARGWISAARDEGKNVIIVTTVLTQSGVLGRLQRDTDGFDVRFADKGLMLHPRFPDWIEISIDEALASAD